MRLAWIVITGILLAILAISGVYFFDQPFFWILLVIIAVVNNIYNGPNYRNKAYFLISTIIIAILALTMFYNFSEINFPINWAFVVILILLIGFLVYEFITREDDSEMPWKDEW